jgi:hypothetical protein
VLGFVSLAGCLLPGTYAVRECPPNPTAYEFHAGVPETKAAILRTFPRGFHFVTSRPAGTPARLDAGYMPIDAAHKWASSFGREIFSQPKNNDDVYLFSFTPLVGKSLVYQSGGEGLDYHATFHLHLTPVAAGRTRVEVFTLNPWVPCGRVFNVHAGSGYVPGIAKVKPTTVEEYQILLRLGSDLKEMGMPALQVPAPSAPTSTRVGP